MPVRTSVAREMQKNCFLLINTLKSSSICVIKISHNTIFAAAVENIRRNKTIVDQIDIDEFLAQLDSFQSLLLTALCGAFSPLTGRART